MFSFLRALLVCHIQLVLLLTAITCGALFSRSFAHWLELDVHIRLSVLLLAPYVLAFLLVEYYPPHSRYSYSERSLL